MYIHTDTIEERDMASKNQDLALEAAEKACIEKYGETVTNKYYKSNDTTTCPAYWDTILCWPPTNSNELSIQPCPNHVLGFYEDNYATRQCTSNGTWFIYPKGGDYWTNYTLCYNSTTATFVDPVPRMNDSLLIEYLPIIKNVSRTGYFVSLNTLIVAFCIIFSIKKLHCARNKLHMHLFASFIFRAAMFFIKDNLFIDGVGMTQDLIESNGRRYFQQELESNNWECKMVTTLWQYFITANYSWILMEGVYLHNLILLALFSDSSNSILFYILLGWGLPAIVVGFYVFSRLLLDDKYCWTTYDSPWGYYIIKIPTMISNIINFILFLNIARVLYLKLRSPINEETKLFRRWARSTLVLVPLFGVHYALLTGMSYSTGVVEVIWLFCDQLFASFQGFFVAVLYCFLNGEVKIELRPHINSICGTLAMFFNCGEFFRTPKGRPSVCTTLSCSSLYNSSVTQRYQNRRSKWDIHQPNGMKPRHSSIPEKYAEACLKCQMNEKTCAEHSTSLYPKDLHQFETQDVIKCTENYCFCSNGNTQITEITACLDKCDHKIKPESTTTDLEMVTLAS